MLFNSYLFVFLFLPVAVAGYAFLGRFAKPGSGLLWLIAVSIAFYAWWRPVNLLIIAPSLLINYVLARGIEKYAEDKPQTALSLLTLGIVGNLAFLAYFKYMNFFLEVSNDLTGTQFVVAHIALPLGISFITFQKIAFLVDVYTGRITSFTFRSYSLFVFFFPQLIAGPIVHYREMMPQFDRATGRISGEDLAVGLGLFAMGLFKKVILADGIAGHVGSVYTSAANGENISLIYAWIATAGFTLQVYFDFSGYSEMALGTARMFGVRLPMNFNSPLKARSILDFWGRWHVTLVQFLTAYVFNPMAFALTRWRMDKGLPILAGKDTQASAFMVMLVLPTMFTMLLSGLWHGAGYGFLIWGVLHGSYLIVNHAWNLYRSRFWSDDVSHARVMNVLGPVLTFVGVVLAMAFFRAPTLAGGWAIAKGMFGLNGVSLPMAIGTQLGPWLPPGLTLEWTSGTAFVQALVWIFLLLAVAWFLPNTLDIFARYSPALGLPGAGRKVKARLQDLDEKRAWWPWRASAGWAAFVALATAIGILALGQPTEFLYWQF